MLTEKDKAEKMGIFICLIFSFYIFLSFFEVYIQQFLGPINRFYMLLMAGILLIISGFSLNLNVYNVSILLWFVFKCLSIAWSNGSNSNEVSSHLASQIGIVLMTAVLSGINYNKRVLDWCIKSLLIYSFLYGILSLFFSRAYHGIFAGRQVLTLFGSQNDPNNNAAFLIFAVSLALYSIVYEHRNMILNTVIILINSYSIFLTGSRAGFLAIAFVVGVVILMYPFRKTRGERKRDNALLSILFILALGFVLVFLSRDYLPAEIRDRLLAFDEYEEGSGRADKWENAMRLFSDSPIFGKGWGGYVLEGSNKGGVHNTFITSLCDGGLLGTILLIIPIIYIIVQAIKKHEILAVVVLTNGVFFALTLDAINKRFFWNSIYIAIMLLNYDKVNSEPIHVWYKKDEILKGTEKQSYKYIR